MNEIEIDAVMTLLPEAQQERIAVGTPCMGKDGKRFTVLGFLDKKEWESNKSKPQEMILMNNFEEGH